ncbi:MAG: hypothetical protein HOA15_06615 [Candidatus Marinimicrobia bacterium]|jgi:hypothetical protein|nr:hypothetical protein [Candidatus Neomarinimicrobiota bacterium]MBT3676004.1 hypothetical protein [Candidatus Neomarinimicrobiota bacterium]MBT3763683.1 hypothetical protein [Candidatus Neomarinimicrobiota bacterium]MBT4067230.1 hypothetical protein [Candidatus Neomarinimicrobiota bacterium]MBT4269805.1 hypothetical protein [Candidatus Neomarinimicrobiota bacterium]
MNKVKSLIFFGLITASTFAQSTYFLVFSWDNGRIEFKEIESVNVSVKHRTPKYISDQFLYVELSQDGRPVYWTAIHDPRKVHAEFPNPDGTLSRQDAILLSADFFIRVPANFDADKIRFLKPSPGRRQRLELDVPLSEQTVLYTIGEIPINLTAKL